MADSQSNGGRPARRSGRRLRLLTFLGAATALIAVVLGAYAAGVLDSAELDSIDARFQIRGSQGAPADVVVVGIDDVTFNELGEQWPFPRSLHGKAIDELSRPGRRRSPTTSSSPSPPARARTTR